MSFSLADILFVIVIFQLLFTSLFLFTHRKCGGRRSSSNGLLGTFFLVIGLDLADNLLLIKGVYLAHPEFALLECLVAAVVWAAVVSVHPVDFVPGFSVKPAKVPAFSAVCGPFHYYGGILVDAGAGAAADDLGTDHG
jgi:hypothetical protein